MARKDRFNGDDLKRLINWSRELSSLSLKETVAFIQKCPRTDQETLLSWCRSDTIVAYPLILSDPLMSGQSFVGEISRPSSPAYTDASQSEAGDFIITPKNPKTLTETEKSAVKKRKVKDLLDFSILTRSH